MPPRDLRVHADREPAVAVAMKTLEERVAVLDSRLSELAVKLGPVLRLAGPSELRKDDPRCASECDLSRAIDVTAERLYLLAGTVIDLRDRLEV